MSKKAIQRAWIFDGHGYPVIDGFSLFVPRANATSAGLVPITKNAYTAANQPQGDTVEVVSSAGGDSSQTATHILINANGDRVTETVSLNGATAVPTTKKYLYWEATILSAVCAGTITIREGSGDAALTTITIGDLHSQVGHFFTGQYKVYLVLADVRVPTVVVTAGGIRLDLLWFPAAATCAAPTTSLTFLDTITVSDTEGLIVKPTYKYPMYLELPPRGYFAAKVVGEGGDDEDVGVLLQGFYMEG